MADQTPPRPPLSSVLPPLILGTATFNKQYVADPHSMPYRSIVSRALSLGVNCFDTSPYYGPSELLLGAALHELARPAPSAYDPAPTPLARSDYMLVTKAGRIVMDEFDYSPAYIRYSVLRSLERLHTPYLDLVYTHDVEFVSPPEVLAAVRELRRLRDEDGVVRYVGISGFPVAVLCDLADMILRETGEPLDAVLSYGHFTVQNRRLGLPAVETGTVGAASPLGRLKAAGVGVVLNASMLGMGLLTGRGIPADPRPEDQDSPLTKWHPSPAGLRLACKEVAGIAAADEDERLESVAIRWALQEWARVGGLAGFGVPARLPESSAPVRVGATVCGVSNLLELEETVMEWRDVLYALEPASSENSAEAKERRDKVLRLVQDRIWPALGEWKDYVWASPGEGYVNSRKPEDKGRPPTEDGVIARYDEARRR